MTLAFRGRGVRVLPAPFAGAPIAYVIGGFERAEEIAAAWADPRASLAFIDCPDWNRDLSPWPAPACFRGGEAFSGEADRFLNELLTEIIPGVESFLAARPVSANSEANPPAAMSTICAQNGDARTNASAAPRAIVGVSLAGLFGVYALFRTAAFSLCASVSGSLWFDGFSDFMASNDMTARPARIYLSLGDREERTKNQRLRPVGEATRAASARFALLGIETRFEMNPGNHFADPVPRLIRALDWLYQ